MKKTSKIENTVFNPSKNTKLTKGMKSQKKTEANARRKVAKDWAHLSRCSKKYKKAVAREFTSRTTQMMKEELFDGILLNLRCQYSYDFLTKRMNMQPVGAFITLD